MESEYFDNKDLELEKLRIRLNQQRDLIIRERTKVFFDLEILEFIDNPALFIESLRNIILIRIIDFLLSYLDQGKDINIEVLRYINAEGICSMIPDITDEEVLTQLPNAGFKQLQENPFLTEDVYKSIINVINADKLNTQIQIKLSREQWEKLLEFSISRDLIIPGSDSDYDSYVSEYTNLCREIGLNEEQIKLVTTRLVKLLTMLMEVARIGTSKLSKDLFRNIINRFINVYIFLGMFI